MNLDGALQTFFAEAEELLNSMEAALLRLGDDYTDMDIVNEIFRAAHTIKGSAGLFGLDDVVSFTHIVENVLDRARDNKIEINGDLLNIILPCRDHIAVLVEHAQQKRDNDTVCLAQGQTLVTALQPWLDTEPQISTAPVTGLKVSSNIDAYINLIESLPEDPQRLGDILVGEQSISPEIVNAALSKQEKINEKKTNGENRFIRVDAGRLDTLINLIGELVVNRQRIDLLASKLGDSTLIEAVASMGTFTESIRDAALTLRMVPVGDTFQKFKRVVRDTAKSLNKEIELEIEGADTELDRSMVEKLNDPLMHIVRNAMDHGIEPVAVRQARGKPAQGTIKLTAYHDAGNIVIGIHDDGGGLDVEKIRNKAIASGILDEATQLSRQDIFQLIFHPGLSTAEQVTNLSGRGVGMDVVKRNIEELQGCVEVESEIGVGTSLIIRLPLTLAIIDGFHVLAGGIDFIVPQNNILECVDLNSLSQSHEQNCVNLRGEQIPYIRLREIFSLQSVAAQREKIVVVQFGEKRAGLVVDDLHGEIQTVVKPMGPIFQALKGIGGSSLLGTGAVALILDVQQLITYAINQEHLRNSALTFSAQEEQS